MNRNTKIMTEQEQQEFWVLLSRPLQTVVLTPDTESFAQADLVQKDLIKQ